MAEQRRDLRIDLNCLEAKRQYKIALSFRVALKTSALTNLGIWFHWILAPKSELA